MARRELRTDQWHRIKDLLPGKKSDAGRTAADNRKFVDAVLWMARTGSQWRELPPEFGNWNSVFQRYNRWAKKDVWESLFKALADDPDFEYVMADATIVGAHQHSAGAKGGSGDASHWPLTRRFDHQTACPVRCARQSAAAHFDTRQCLRQHASRAFAGWHQGR